VRLEAVRVVALTVVNTVMDRMAVTARRLEGGFLGDGDRRNRHASRERNAANGD
jgi:hypothetical protein